jgi:predicted nucleic acid-binding Zn ribbon protein
MLFSRKTKSVECVVCGKAIAPKERRFVEKNRHTRVERHTHVACQELANRGKP